MSVIFLTMCKNHHLSYIIIYQDFAYILIYDRILPNKKSKSLTIYIFQKKLNKSKTLIFFRTLFSQCFSVRMSFWQKKWHTCCIFDRLTVKIRNLKILCQTHDKIFFFRKSVKQNKLSFFLWIF